MDWLALILAGLFEMGGVILISKTKSAPSSKSYMLLTTSFSLSFFFLSIAMKTIPMGTAYAVWTGIGAAGTVIIGMIWLGEPRDLGRLVCIFLIIAGVIGLRLHG